MTGGEVSERQQVLVAAGDDCGVVALLAESGVLWSYSQNRM